MPEAPIITKKLLRDWIVGAYASSIGIEKDFSLQKAKMSAKFGDEVIEFLEKQNLLNKDMK